MLIVPRGANPCPPPFSMAPAGGLPLPVIASPRPYSTSPINFSIKDDVL